MFHQKGMLVYERSKIEDFDKVFDLALESGAEDVNDEESAVEITCGPSEFSALKEALDGLGL